MSTRPPPINRAQVTREARRYPDPPPEYANSFERRLLEPRHFNDWLATQSARTRLIVALFSQGRRK